LAENPFSNPKPGSRDGGTNCRDDTNNIIAEDGGQGSQSRGQEETGVAGESVNWVEAGSCDADLNLVLRGEWYGQPGENQGFPDFGQG
jgi:hypothetical protein